MSAAKPKLFQRWSDAEKATFRRVYPDGGIEGVMAATGRTRGAVQWMLGVLKVKRSKYWTASHDDLIRAK